MTFKDYFKKDKLTLSELYLKLKSIKPQNDFRDAILFETGMAKSTFWQKLKGEREFTENEKSKIATISGRKLNDLFPCK